MPNEPLRVAVVSHAAVIPVNQEPFHHLGVAGAEVTVICPAVLETDIRGRVGFKPLEGFAGRLVPVPVLFGGHRRWLGGQRGIHAIVYGELARALAGSRAQVVFVEEEPYSLAAWQVARICAPRRIPLVVHQNQNVPRRLPQPFRSIGGWVLARAAGVTVRNRAAADLVRSAGFPGPVHAFPHAVDPARYRARARRSGLEPPVVGFVGRLVPEKGILGVVDAVAAMRERTGAGSLLVVGDGPLGANARGIARARSVPAVFVGAVAHEDVPRWYGEMDLVAVPSRTTATWKEQFGRIVIEANCAGVPVVVSDSGELPETVAATGGGVVVPEGDQGALADALGRLATDEEERRKLGEAGRAAVRERFTPRAVARDLLAFLREAAG